MRKNRFSVKEESFPEREERILRFWEKEKIFEKSLENRKGAPYFSFYDGPPFATGLPHYGHLLAGTIKDIIPRYKTMKGYLVPRRFGWDCHGLPVENEIEKAQELSGAKAIESFGIAKFNEECRGIVLRYTEQWRFVVERMGRWVDFSKAYRTMDPSFMESVWWVFKELFKKGLIYEGFKVMPFSAKLGTPLSNFEANLNYQEVDDPSLTVKFLAEEEENTYFLAWTTTPWTLVSNLALVVHPKIIYVKIWHKEKREHYVLAEDRLSVYFPDKQEYEVKRKFLGETLKGRSYLPLFSYFFAPKKEPSFLVIVDEFVSTEEGTGIVHAAPAFGETDFFACKKEGIEPVCPVDNNGRFTKEIKEWEGVLVKDADKSLMKRLKEEGKVFRQGTVRHRYPFCWRSDTPLIYKAVNTWFIAVESLKEKLLEMNERIHWVPAHIKKGRFGKWLFNARDWAISRNRYWGTPIPLWKSEEGDLFVIGSKKELEEKVGKKVEDLHRHYVDDLSFVYKGKKYQRIPEVFDCWFESGSMPYGQNHFPFEKQDLTLKTFPADFIAEGLDQTRGWFYTLTVLAAALFQKPAFKNVVVNGIILAEDGNKMSKKLKNYPEPSGVINSYGADAVRLYLLHSAAVRGEDLRFSEKGVELILRQILLPLWSSYSFLATYANIYSFNPSEVSLSYKKEIDCWIVSQLQKLVIEVTTALDQYELSSAVEPFIWFIEQLTNWYIRRSRSRFWAEEDTEDRREAFATLYQVLLTLSKVAAPFIPFLSEALYQGLKMEKDVESVHLCDFPLYDKELRNHKLEEEMELTQRVVRLGHSLRKEQKLKVRQPLSYAAVICGEEKVLQALKNQKTLIEGELNIKELRFYQEESSFVSISIKPNFRVLGKKVGALMPKVQKEIENLPKEQCKALLEQKEVELLVGKKKLMIHAEDVQVSRSVKEGLSAINEGEVTVMIHTKLTPELLMEGLAREIINKVNTMRRDLKLHVSDRITITIDTTERVKACLQLYQSYISHEVLAKKVVFSENEGVEWDLNGEKAIISVERFTS